MFAAVTAILMAGAGCERARLGPMMVFLFIWLTVVYCPIAYWTWGGNGWLVSLGALDFAGGGPVHENSGFAALAYSLWLARDMTQLPRAKFQNTSHIRFPPLLWAQSFSGLVGTVSTVGPLVTLPCVHGTPVSIPILLPQLVG